VRQQFGMAEYLSGYWILLCNW